MNFLNDITVNNDVTAVGKLQGASLTVTGLNSGSYTSTLVENSGVVYKRDLTLSLLPTGTEGQMLYNNAGTWTAFSSLFWDDTNNRFGVGISSSLTARLHVQGHGTGTTYSARFEDSAGTEVLRVRDDGQVSIRQRAPDATYGSDLITNGTFNTDLSGWTVGGADWSWDATGKAAHAATGATTLSQLSATIGQHYRVKFTIAKTSGTNVAVSFGGVALVTYTANSSASYTYDALATTTAGFVVTPTSDFVGTIDSVSVFLYSAAAAPNLVFYGTNGTTVAGALRFSNATYNIAIGDDVATKFGVDSTNNIGIGYQALGNGYQLTNTVAIGTAAGRNLNNCSANVYIGSSAGSSATSGSANTAVGSGAMTSATSGGGNTAIGMSSLRVVGSGSCNIGVGAYSLYSATGSYNTVVGYFSGFYITSGTGHVLVGTQAGMSLVSGTNNVAIGYQAMYNPNGATGGNTAIGYRSLFGVASNAFSNNTAVGYNAGVAVTTGGNNVLVGYAAGDNITSGANNLVIGYNIDAQSATASNQMAIGNALFGTTISGTGTTISPGFLGVFVTSPTAKLHLPAGTATANTAPLKFTSGVNLTAAEAGAMEWDGTNLFITQTSGPTRKTIAFTDSLAITNDTSTNAVVYPTWVTATSGTLPLKVSSTGLSFNPLAKSLAISTTAPTSSIAGTYELAPAIAVGGLNDTYGRWGYIAGLITDIPTHSSRQNSVGHEANILAGWTFRSGTLSATTNTAGVTVLTPDGVHTPYLSTGVNDLPDQSTQWSFINSTVVASGVIVTYDFDTALNGVNYQKLHTRGTAFEYYRPVVAWKGIQIGQPTNIKVTITYSSDGTATTSTVFNEMVIFDAAPTWYGELWVGPASSLETTSLNWIRRVKFEFTLPTTSAVVDQGRILYIGLLINHPIGVDVPGIACRNRWYYSQNYRNGAALRWEANASAGPWTAKDHIWGNNNNLYVYAPQSGGAIQIGWDKSGTATNTITGVYESSTHKFRPANVSENVQLGDATYMWNGGFFGGALDITRPASNASIYQRVAGETDARMALYDNRLEFGSGATTRDITISRSGANLLSLSGCCVRIPNASSGGSNYTLELTRTYTAAVNEKAMVYAGPTYTQVEANIADLQQVFRANPVFSYTASNPTACYIFTSYSLFTGSGGTSSAVSSFYSGANVATGHTVSSFAHYRAANVVGTGTWGTIAGLAVQDQPTASSVYGFISSITSGANRYSIYTGSAVSYFGGVIQSAVSTGTAPFTIASTTLNTNLNADLWDDQQLNTHTASVRANTVITGGGTISLSASAELTWSQRMIVIANGRGSWFSTTGFFDITVPTAGTTITGVGGASDQTVTASGIPITNGTNYWCALYYILPIGSNNASIAANFRLVSYTSDFEIPDTWVCIARRNPDSGLIHLGVGPTLRLGESVATGTNSSVNPPYFGGQTSSYYLNTSSGAQTKSGGLTVTQLTSSVSTGTAPLVVSSTTKVTNLNADLLNDQSGSYYLTDTNQTLPSSFAFNMDKVGTPFSHYLGTVGDDLAFRLISNQEYWDFASPGWVASTSDDLQSLLTGKVGGALCVVPPGRRKFRFTVPISPWLGSICLAVHQTYYTTGAHQVTVTVETGTTSSGTWTTYINGVSSPATEVNYHFFATATHNKSDTWARITIESADSTNSTGYTGLQLLYSYTRSSSMAGGPVFPFTWNYKKEITFSAKTTFLVQPTIQLAQPSLVLRQTGDANNHRWIDVNNNTFRILKTNDAYDTWSTQLAISTTGFMCWGGNVSNPTHALHVSTTASNLALLEGTRSDGPVYLWMTNLNTPSITWGLGMRADGGFEIHRSGAGAVMQFGTNSWDVQIHSQLQINAVQGLRIHGTVARQYWYDTDGTADSRLWDLAVNDNGWYFRLVNDAQSSTTAWLSVVRSGLTVSSISFTGKTSISSTEALRLINSGSSANGARLLWSNPAASVGERIWDASAYLTNLVFRVGNDAEDTWTTWMDVVRSGSTISSISLTATSFKINTYEVATQSWVSSNYAYSSHTHSNISVSTQHSLTGGGDLSTNRTLSLVNDAASPGNSYYYGTNGAGAKGWYALPSPGTGTVTSVSVVTANGFAGDVATATTTPAITLRTSVTGLLKGNGTGISAAVAGTDYSDPSHTHVYTAITMASQRLIGRGSAASGASEEIAVSGAGGITPSWAASSLTLTMTATPTFTSLIVNGGNSTLKAASNTTTSYFTCFAADPTGTGAALQCITPANVLTVIGGAASSHTHSNISVSTQYSLTGGGDLSTNRTLNLVGDVASPGNNYYYGTNGTGTRGWYSSTFGTVTSVALSAPSIFSVSGSPVTSSGTLTFALTSQLANTVWAAPNGSAGTPSFRTLVAADIPSLPYAASSHSHNQSDMYFSNTSRLSGRGTAGAGYGEEVAVSGAGGISASWAASSLTLTMTSTPSFSSATITGASGLTVNGGSTILKASSTASTSFFTCFSGDPSTSGQSIQYISPANVLSSIGGAAASHAHGNITSSGYLGSTASVPLITGTGGIIQAGSFGNTAGTFCQGNDARLSDNRYPTSHNQAYSTIDNITTSRLLGRTTAATGACELISVGTGLGLSATTLSTSGAYTANGYTMSTARLLGRTTASSGAAEEISLSNGTNCSATLSGGVLTIAISSTPSFTNCTVTGLMNLPTSQPGSPVNGSCYWDGSTNKFWVWSSTYGWKSVTLT